jgi:hypothetical protein
MKEVKQFQFQKGEHIFSYFYDDARAVINDLVDVADSDESTLELTDVLAVVRGVSIYEKLKPRLLGSKIMMDNQEAE